MTDERLKLKTEIKLAALNLVGQIVGLCLLGSAGTFVMEFVKKEPNSSLLNISFAGALILTFVFGCIVCLFIDEYYAVGFKEEERK